jgi:glucose/arabinose dehydrogenase
VVAADYVTISEYKMEENIMIRVLAAIAVFCFGTVAAALDTSRGEVRVEPVVIGLDAPWSFGFLPDGRILITERSGRLLLVDGETTTPVSGLPEIADVGQGGLLDVLVPRDFVRNREIFMSYAKLQGRGAGTALMRGRLASDGRSLSDVETIFELDPGTSGGKHFGSRIVEAPDGTLFLTIGDRGDRNSAQDLSIQTGTVVRVTRDGSAPRDNPFVGQAGAQPEIWSFGHRNPQGAALDLDGNLLVVEHGARGGDEVNRVQKGANYGWPVISYGQHYSGRSIGEGTAKDGLEQPDFFWDPSMAPSGMMIYSGALWPEWRGDIFVGSLKFDYISRLDGTPMTEVEQLTGDETLRVRDVREGPNGGIWFLSVGNGTLYRMTPN